MSQLIYSDFAATEYAIEPLVELYRRQRLLMRVKEEPFGGVDLVPLLEQRHERLWAGNLLFSISLLRFLL